MKKTKGIVARSAKELVERFFKLAQMGTQLVDHCAHRLSIADAAVELFHPGFERLRMTTFTSAVDAAGELHGARSQLPIVRVEVFESRFEVQHRGRDFHGKHGGRRLTGAQ